MYHQSGGHYDRTLQLYSYDNQSVNDVRYTLRQLFASYGHCAT